MVRTGDAKAAQRGQDHLADCFERDAVVPPVEPDQRLPVRRRAIGPGVHVDDLVGRILRGRLERRLDAAAGRTR
jgi:hypothetical protein